MSTCQHVNTDSCTLYTSYVVRLHVSALYFHVLLTFCFDASHHSFMHTCILVLTLQSCHRSIPTSLPSRTSWCVYVMRRVSSINTSIHYKRHLNFPCTWSDDQDEGNEAQSIEYRNVRCIYASICDSATLLLSKTRGYSFRDELDEHASMRDTCDYPLLSHSTLVFTERSEYFTVFFTPDTRP